MNRILGGEMLQRSVMARMFVMGVLLLVLMVPLGMTSGVISERTARRDEVARDISRTWGDRQAVTGPVLTVPYRYLVNDAGPTVALQAGGRPAPPRAVVQAGVLVLLPEQLDVKGTMDPEERARGPFSTVVYKARLAMKGRFSAPDTSVVRRPDVTFLWDEATVSLGIADPRGIATGFRLTWAGKEVDVIPGAPDTGLFADGVQARGLQVAPEESTAFDIALDLRGTRSLGIVPVGNHTDVTLSSPWPHPGFSGGQLPATHRVSAQGFEARWQAAWFARGFPAAWIHGEADADRLKAQASASALGVDLVQPVDVYLQSERAVKYAALFIVLTLAVAFVREIASHTLVHPVQYLFVGFGLCLFYLLLVSLAEHIRFDVAYLVASAATALLIAWYWSGVLRSRGQGVYMAVALTALYGYLYLLLRLEDLALVAGATGLFVMLAIIMAMTRHVNWFALRLGAQVSMNKSP